MSTSFRHGRHSAFTLIELLVSVAVGSYLISMAAVCISMSLKASKNANMIAAQAKAGSSMMEWLWSNRTTAQWTVNTSLNGISAFRAASQQLSFATGTVYGTNYSTGSFYHQSAIAAIPTYKLSSLTNSSGIVANTQEDTPFLDGQYVFIYAPGGTPFQAFTVLPTNARLGTRSTRTWDTSGYDATAAAATVGPTARIGYATHFPLPVPSIKVQRP